MKTKDAQRFINAYKRLKVQIDKKIYSKEFTNRIKNLENPEQDKAREIYWKTKNKEIKTLESKLGGYI